MHLATTHRAFLTVCVLVALASSATPMARSSGLFSATALSDANSMSAAVVNPPPHVSAAALDATSILVEWVASDTAFVNGYRVSRALTPGGPYDLLGTTDAHTLSWTDGGLTPETAYYYVVEATGGGWTSLPSIEAAAETIP